MSKLIRWLLIGLIVLWVIHDPISAAAQAQKLWTGLSNVGSSLATFASRL